MIRPRNREITNRQKSKTVLANDKYDPVKLYQQYIQNFQSHQKMKGFSQNQPLKLSKNSNCPCMSKPLRLAGPVFKQPETIVRARSKSTFDATQLQQKFRPKAAVLKNKPVKSLEEYDVSSGKKEHLEADEIECFFGELRKLVEGVVEAKLTNVMNKVVDDLTKKIEVISQNVQRTESHIIATCSELENKMAKFAEAQLQIFHYIGMKMGQDELLNLHNDNSVHPAETSEIHKKLADNSEPEPPFKPSSNTIPNCLHKKCQNTGWSHQAGDSASNNKAREKSGKLFNHSLFGPFQQVTRNADCYSVKEEVKQGPIGSKEALGGNSPADVVFESLGSRRSKLGIKEFLDTVKSFQRGRQKSSTGGKHLKPSSEYIDGEIDDLSSLDNGLSIGSSDES